MISLTSNRKTYSLKETAAVLGVSLATIYRRVDDGTLPSIHFGRRVLVPVEAVDRLVAAFGMEAK